MPDQLAFSAGFAFPLFDELLNFLCLQFIMPAKEARHHFPGLIPAGERILLRGSIMF